MADQDIKMLIERIMAEARTHQSARFSHEVYADEPILKTGRQMQNFLPDHICSRDGVSMLARLVLNS